MAKKVSSSRKDRKRAKARPSPARKKRIAKKSPARARKRADPSPKSADDSVARARELATRGAFRDAFDICAGILAADPANWPAKHLMALILWSTNHREQAVPLMAEAIVNAPDTADIRGAHVPELLHMAAKSNLKTDLALALAERTVARHGPSYPLLEGLTTLHLARGAPALALAVAERLVQLYPQNPKAHFVLSAPLLVLGRDEDAVAAYGRGLRPLEGAGPDSPDPIKRQYGALAGGYDQNPLHQSFSARMAGFIERVVGDAADKRILDAGCGTGLLATRLKAARLVGIDLSTEMLAQARARGIYSELFEGDMVAAMASRTDRFDVVAASCALYHLADLEPFFRQAARVLAPGGHLVFSVDPAPDSLDVAQTNPREYAHSRRYLRELARRSGLAEIAIRIMEHRYYLGFWCAFQKSA